MAHQLWKSHLFIALFGAEKKQKMTTAAKTASNRPEYAVRWIPSRGLTLFHEVVPEAAQEVAISHAINAHVRTWTGVGDVNRNIELTKPMLDAICLDVEEKIVVRLTMRGVDFSSITAEEFGDSLRYVFEHIWQLDTLQFLSIVGSPLMPDLHVCALVDAICTTPASSETNLQRLTINCSSSEMVKYALLRLLESCPLTELCTNFDDNLMHHGRPAHTVLTCALQTSSLRQLRLGETAMDAVLLQYSRCDRVREAILKRKRSEMLRVKLANNRCMEVVNGEAKFVDSEE